MKIIKKQNSEERREMILNGNILNTLLLLPADVAHLPVSIINKNFIKTLKKHGKLVHAADCNDKISIQKINKLNCDQFSTNEVELAQTTLK